MTAYSANPFGYIFPIIAVALVICYFLYATFDRLGLDVNSATGTVVTKQYTQRGKTYNTTIIDGRSVVQSQATPETYAVVLDVGNERTSALVSKMLYESVQTNDSVQVRVRRTRITRRLEVVDVNR